jgi:hypothetical protein
MIMAIIQRKFPPYPKVKFCNCFELCEEDDIQATTVLDWCKENFGLNSNFDDFKTNNFRWYFQTSSSEQLVHYYYSIWISIYIKDYNDALYFRLKFDVIQEN